MLILEVPIEERNTGGLPVPVQEAADFHSGLGLTGEETGRVDGAIYEKY